MAKIIPVIHTINQDQVEYNVKLCRDNGIYDIFLIDHRITDESLLKTEKYIRWIREFIQPAINIGVNYLQLDTIAAMKEAHRLGADYIWADRSYIEHKTLPIAEEILFEHEYTQHNTKYFGCVAFKYQRPVKDLEWTCRTACDYMDVITTSGDATGKPPSIDKIKSMRGFIGNKPMAIASGITPENKSDYENLVDYFLIASSITDSSEMIIESRLKQLLK